MARAGPVQLVAGVGEAGLAHLVGEEFRHPQGHGGLPGPGRPGEAPADAHLALETRSAVGKTLLTVA